MGKKKLSERMPPRKNNTPPKKHRPGKDVKIIDKKDIVPVGEKVVTPAQIYGWYKLTRIAIAIGAAIARALKKTWNAI